MHTSSLMRVLTLKFVETDHYVKMQNKMKQIEISRAA